MFILEDATYLATLFAVNGILAAYNIFASAFNNFRLETVTTNLKINIFYNICNIY